MSGPSVERIEFNQIAEGFSICPARNFSIAAEKFLSLKIDSLEFILCNYLSWLFIFARLLAWLYSMLFV